MPPRHASTIAQLAVRFARTPREVSELLEIIAEEWSERAAAREHLGALPRGQAEHYAIEDTFEHFHARYMRQIRR